MTQGIRNISMRFLALLILIACLVFFSNGKTEVLLGMSQSNTLTVISEQQSDSPLQISSIEVSSSRPDIAQPEFELVKVTALITNIGNSPIAAFAISHGTLNDSKKTGVMFLNFMTADQSLQPGQSKTFAIFSSPSNKVNGPLGLAIDYVEFIDGKKWGDDKLKTSQQLLGQRAGAKGAKTYFSKLLKERGREAIKSEISNNSDEITVPQGNPPNWEDGYRTGFKITRNRLRKADEKGGQVQLEKELQTPFDATEGRRNQ